MLDLMFLLKMNKSRLLIFRLNKQSAKVLDPLSEVQQTENSEAPVGRLLHESLDLFSMAMIQPLLFASVFFCFFSIPYRDRALPYQSSVGMFHIENYFHVLFHNKGF